MQGLIVNPGFLGREKRKPLTRFEALIEAPVLLGATMMENP